jgi:hypothetical protein
MSSSRAALAVSLLASLLATPRAEAGYVVEMTHQEGRTSTFHLEGNRWRIDNSAPKAGKPGKAEIIIYDGATRTMYFADPGTKTFKSVDQAQVEANLAAGQARMKEAMARMTPEQRKRVEEAMKGQAGAFDLPEINYEKTGRTGSAAGYRCTFYRESMKGDPELAEVCIASFEDTGVRKEDFKVLMDMPGAKASNRTSTMWTKSPGVPLIRERRGPDGKMHEDLRVTSLKRTSVPADTFRVPAGYAKKGLDDR